MARPHRPVRGSVYEKRRVSAVAPPPPDEGLSSADARRLGEQIASTQSRYRVAAIRLITGRACGLTLVDSLTGADLTVTTLDDWARLEAESA